MGPESINRDQILWRLRSAAGHTAGIGRMLENEAPCLEVVRQIHAVQCALREVAKQLLFEHVCRRLAEDGTMGDGGREELLIEVGELLKLG